MIKSSNYQPINFSINPDHVRLQSSMLGRVNKTNTIKKIYVRNILYFTKKICDFHRIFIITVCYYGGSLLLGKDEFRIRTNQKAGFFRTDQSEAGNFESFCFGLYANICKHILLFGKIFEEYSQL